jgi:hypothetical protein
MVIDRSLIIEIGVAPEFQPALAIVKAYTMRMRFGVQLVYINLLFAKSDV